ncbi:MAG: hypothetical protein AAB449_01900 [Patescibacteria group bacterium]
MEITARFEYGAYLWGIGAFLGGLVAYVIVDFRRLRTGVNRAYHQSILWRPNSQYWKAVGVGQLAALAICTSGGFGFVVMSEVFSSVAPFADGEYLLWIKIPAGIVAALSFIGLIFSGGLAVLCPLLLSVGSIVANLRLNDTEENYAKHLQDSTAECWRIARELNPFTLVGTVVKTAPKIFASIPSWIMRVIRKGWDGVISVGRFIGYTFVYVHSERRKICFVNATLGATIGYSFGSASLGAIAGAILGVISYQVVAVWWLKLAPAQVSTD